MDDDQRKAFFGFFNEIGIISQLTRTMIEYHLPNDMGLPHFSVLNHLIRVSDGRTPLDLARAFQVPKTSMTHTLAGLEAAGYVEMRANPRDGRSKCVWLTAAGRAFRDEAIERLGPDISALAETFDIRDIETATAYLGQIRAFLDAARD